jgi:hypothetical protein
MMALRPCRAGTDMQHRRTACLDRREAAVDRDPERLRNAGRADFRHHDGAIGFHGARTEIEPTSDQRIGHAGVETLQDLDAAGIQRVQFCRRLSLDVTLPLAVVGENEGAVDGMDQLIIVIGQVDEIDRAIIS